MVNGFKFLVKDKYKDVGRNKSGRLLLVFSWYLIF